MAFSLVSTAEDRELLPRSHLLSEIAVGTDVSVLKTISLERSVSRQFRVIQFQFGKELQKGENPLKTADSAQIFGTLPNTAEVPVGDDYRVCGVDHDSKYVGFDIRKASCDPRKAKKGSFWIYYSFGSEAPAGGRALSDLFETLGMNFEFRP